MSQFFFGVYKISLIAYQMQEIAYNPSFHF